MAPKKAPASKPKVASTSAHGSYQEMIKIAIVNLKDRKGSSRQAIKKYIQANNDLGATTDAAFTSHVNRALIQGEKAGAFERPKGPSGPVKVKKPSTDAAKPAAAKPAAKKPAAKPKTAAKPAAEKKPKAAPKKAAAKPKANASAKKAPAVEAKPTVVLGKTKSGRVTKTAAPKKAAPKKPAAKKAAPKKAAPKKEA